MRLSLALPRDDKGVSGSRAGMNRLVGLSLEVVGLRRHCGLGQRVSASLLLIVLVGWGAGCKPRPSTVVAAGDDSGVIKIGYAIEAPYAFVENGVVTGEGPTIAAHVAGRLGRRPEWVQVPFGELIEALEAHRIDVIAAGLFITPQRAQRVAFSRPTTRVVAGVLTAGSRQCAEGALAWVVRDRPRLAVLPGSVEETWLLGLPGIEREVVRVPDARTGAVAVESGVVDGLLLSLPTVRDQVRRRPGAALQAMMLSGDVDGVRAPPPADVALAFRRDDAKTVLAWNAVLREFLESPAHRLVEAKFGFGEVDRVYAGEEGEGHDHAR